MVAREKLTGKGYRKKTVGVTSKFTYYCVMEEDSSQWFITSVNFAVVVVKGITRGAASLARQAPATVSAYTIKHSTSHSSIVSSLGEDSGLGQISPVGNGILAFQFGDQ